MHKTQDVVVLLFGSDLVSGSFPPERGGCPLLGAQWKLHLSEPPGTDTLSKKEIYK